MDNGTSLSGRARRFAEEVNEMHCSMNDAVDGNCERIGLGTIPVDDVVWQAKLLLIQQEQFRRQGKPTAVDVGYLYASDKNNSNNWRRRIRNNGLMTRQSEQHRSGGNSILAQYGDGIYTSSNPYSYHLHHNHGAVDDGNNNNTMPDDDNSMRSFVGLFVLRLIGKALDPFEARMLAASSSVTTTSAGTNNREDCCAVNQGTGDEWMVLRQASQCIAVISFPASLVRPDTTNSAYSGNVIVYGYHCKLQAIVDRFFNHHQSSSSPTPVTGTSPDPAVLKAATPPPEERQGGGGGGTFPQQQQHQRQPRRHQRSASLPNAAAAAVNNENRNTNNNNGDKKKNNPFRGFAKSLGLARNNNNRSTIASSDQVSAGLSRRNSSSGRRNDHPTVIVVPDSTGDGLVAIPMAHIATVSYVAPERITSGSSHHGTGTNNVECFLCNNARKFRDDAPSVRCSSCRIEFHLECITTELVNKRRNTCPHCGGVFGALRGPSPAGTMRISTSKNLHCSSVSRGSVGIVYDMPAAVQKPYHKHPGHHHAGTKRTALLPATPEGLDLLKRLQAAFLQGLTFRVGTSMTTGKHNSVVWASIPHKTHPTSGPPFGFPDPHYIVTCNAILDALGVPPDDEL